jgi:antitoxin component YwqK of YwqJK toxin-antitoxin module
MRILYEDLCLDVDCHRMMYADMPFNGVAYRNDISGQVVYDCGFVGGIEWGILREWYPSGSRKLVMQVWNSVIHEEGYEWYESGKPKRWSRGECSYTLEWREWSEQGNLLINEELPPDLCSLYFHTWYLTGRRGHRGSGA